MAAKNTDKSTMNPAHIDDLGFFSTIKMGVVTPIKTSLKLAVTGLIVADAMASTVYDNREDTTKIVKQGIKQINTFAKVGVLGMAKLNKEMGDAMGVNLNDDIDVLIDQIYNEKEDQQ